MRGLGSRTAPCGGIEVSMMEPVVFPALTQLAFIKAADVLRLPLLSSTYSDAGVTCILAASDALTDSHQISLRQRWLALQARQIHCIG